MQINLMHHPDAFASLEEAFEPTRNVAYGARFLGQLRDETQSWTRAVERYHYRTVAQQFVDILARRGLVRPTEAAAA